MKASAVCVGPVLAAKLAQEIGLSLGNFWEPGISREIETRLQGGENIGGIESDLRFQLGCNESKELMP